MGESCRRHFLLVSLLCLSACSGGGSSGNSSGGSTGTGGGSTSTISSASVSCTPTSITTTQTSTCTATVSGTGSYSSGVTWTATNGTITSSGVFTPSSAGSATITATSTQDATKSGSASVTVTQASPITSVSVACTPAIVPADLTAQCSATVTGTGQFNSGVTWTASSGSIASATSTTATYTAPTHAAGAVTITATSAADSTKAGSATITATHAPLSGAWQRNGPVGALDMSVLTEDLSHPGTIYASGYGQASGGLWKSTDSGGTWANVATNTLLDQLPLSDIAVANGGLNIYAASIRSSKFFQSLDGGTTWNTIVLSQSQIGSGTIGGMAVDPSDYKTIYLSVGGTGVLKSSDQGSTWTLLVGSPVITDSSLTDILHNPIAVDPSSSLIVYYGTDQGLYKSSDSGTHWSLVTSGIAASDKMIRDIAPGTAGSNTMWLLAGAGTSSTVDLYVSTNQGASWTPKALGVDAQRVNPDPNSATTIYLCGFTTHWVYKSTDSGVTFLKADNGLPPGVDPTAGPIQVFGPIGVLLPLKASNTFLVGTYGGGIFKTTDGASNWTVASTNISAWPGTDVAIDPSNAQNIFLGTSGSGIFKSTNGSSTWTPLVSGTFYAIAVDPFSSNHILANVLTSDGASHLRQSTDGGATWTEITPAVFGTTPTISTINFHPKLQGTIFVALTSGAGLFRSTDGGISWTSVKTLTSQTTVGDCVAFNPANTQSIMVTDSNLVYTSTDGGNTWTQQSGHATCPLAVDTQANPAVVYAGVPAYKSTDFGQTWTALNVTGRAIPDPALANGIIMVGKQASGQPDIQWSPDGGTTWYPSSTMSLGWPILQPNVQQGLGVAVSPASSEQLYITSLTNSIFMLPVGP